MTDQLIIKFPVESDFSDENFMPLKNHEIVLAALNQFPKNPGDVLVIYGAEGIGKTHLLHVWARRRKAVYVPAAHIRNVEPPVQYLAVDALEDIEQTDQEHLFHLFNHIKQNEGGLVVTSRVPPAQLDLIPELKSRLLTGQQLELADPEDAELEMLLVKWAQDRQLQLDMAVVKYVLPRVERSPKALQSFLEKVDHLALARQRKITVPLVKEVLEHDATAQ